MRFALALLLASALPAVSAPCGGDFNDFKAAMAAEAAAQGLPDAAIRAFLDGAQIDKGVLKADRGQGFFRKNFLEFSQALISGNRLKNAGVYSKKYDRAFDEAARRFGVSRGIILAFWAFETDFGQVQGDFDTRNALMTLAHDCRRPELFQPQVLAAIALTAKGDFDPGVTKGAWAGEIGQVQMLPRDILERGEDGDGDGLITLKTSAPDAVLSAAHMLQYHGWRAGEPWLQEVVVPDQMDWSPGRGRQGVARQSMAGDGREGAGGRLDQPARLAFAADGAQGAGFPCLSELQGLVRVEQKLRLCDDGGPISPRGSRAPRPMMRARQSRG